MYYSGLSSYVGEEIVNSSALHFSFFGPFPPTPKSRMYRGHFFIKNGAFSFSGTIALGF